MAHSAYRNNDPTHTFGLTVSTTAVIGLILVIALFAFETFNFDTTRYALRNLLGDVNFGGLRWATILAVAFCAIDFVGLARLFTPEQNQGDHNAVWYLMGAWLLGATMNALMTWWAVSLTLLTHNFGNEVVSREQLLQIVPMFVAALVWLIRILFIGAFSMAGEHLFISDEKRKQHTASRRSVRELPPTAPGLTLVTDRDTAVFPPTRRPPHTPPKPKRERIRQRPPMPHRMTNMPSGMVARSRHR